MTDNGKKTKLYLENDFCIINKKDNKFYYSDKKNNIRNNILGEVVNSLITEYTNSTMSFDTFQYLEDYCKGVDTNYDNSLLFINSMIRQYKLLAEKGKTIFSLNMSNVIVIDKTLFVFIGCGGIDDIGAGVIDIVNKNKIYANRKKAIENAGGELNKIFLAPEFNKSNDLGSDDEEELEDESVKMLHYNTCNYSIGVILMYWFNGALAFKTQSFKKKCESLLKIHNSKVYYLIKRCIDTDSSLRGFLLI